MIQIAVNDTLSNQLRSIVAPCIIVDAAGNKLGEFLPRTDLASYEGYECPLSREEILRIKQEGGGRPLADILRDLESRS